jgi:hypothetical protein
MNDGVQAPGVQHQWDAVAVVISKLEQFDQGTAGGVAPAEQPYPVDASPTSVQPPSMNLAP